MDLNDYSYPQGLELLNLWQSGDALAKQELKAVFDAAIEGQFDQNFSILAPTDEVSVVRVFRIGEVFS